MRDRVLSAQHDAYRDSQRMQRRELRSWTSSNPTGILVISDATNGKYVAQRSAKRMRSGRRRGIGIHCISYVSGRRSRCLDQSGSCGRYMHYPRIAMPTSHISMLFDYSEFYMQPIFDNT